MMLGGFAQWDQHIDVTTTLSFPAKPTTAACLCGLSATATTTAEMTAMSRDVVSLMYGIVQGTDD